MYDYEIKITGIDNNKNKSIWIPFNNKITEDKICTKVIDNFIRIKKKDDKNYYNTYLSIKNNIINSKSFIIENQTNINKINYILNIFEKNKNEINIKKICICGNENFLTILKEYYNTKLLKLFKSIDYLLIKDLLHIKNEYNISGSVDYKISKNKKNKIFDYDLLIMDEIILQDDIYYNYLKENLSNVSFYIILRNIYQIYNKLNNNIDIIKIEEEESDIINNLIVNEISNIKNYDNNIFKQTIKNLLLKNKNITINNDLNLFNNSYYTNKENNIIIDINNICIKQKLKMNDEIIYIDDGIYKLDKIKKINVENIKHDILNYKNLIDINKNKKITLTNLKHKYDKNLKFYKENDTENIKEYISQEYLNYIIQNTKIDDYLKNIFELINNINNIKSYSIETYNNLNILVLTNYETEIFLKKIKIINIEIYKLYEKLNEKKNKSYIKYIINGLQELVNINKKQIFQEVYEKNYFISKYINSINDYENINKFITFNLNNIYINLSNILNKNDINSISKLIFIYNCLNIYSKHKIVYIGDYKII